MSQWTGEAGSEEEAITRGLRALAITLDQSEIHVLGEQTSKLLSMFGYRRFRVRVSEKPPRFRPPREENPPKLRQPERKERRRPPEIPRRSQAPKPPPPVKTPPRVEKSRPVAAVGRPRSAVPPEELLAQWKTLFGWEDLAWEVGTGDAKPQITLKTRHGERLAGGGGKPLAALEYLFNLVASGGDRSRAWVAFRVEGFPGSDDQRVVDQALHAAFQVRRTGRPFYLNPMPSAQRRLVHQALANNPDVATASEGDGPARKVVVVPRSKESQGDAGGN